MTASASSTTATSSEAPISALNPAIAERQLTEVDHQTSLTDRTGWIHPRAETSRSIEVKVTAQREDQRTIHLAR
jgi:hypothetical protein